MAPRAVADTNVWVAAAISPGGVCGQVVRAAIDGRWQPVACPRLFEELADVLGRPKFRRWVTTDEAARFVSAVAVLAEGKPDPTPSDRPITSDPDDDFLILLAREAGTAVLVSGDPHLIALAGIQPAVLTPRQFLEWLPE